MLSYRPVLVVVGEPRFANDSGQNLCVDGRLCVLTFLVLVLGSGLLASNMGCSILLLALINLYNQSALINLISKAQSDWFITARYFSHSRKSSEINSAAYCVTILQTTI